MCHPVTVVMETLNNVPSTYKRRAEACTGSNLLIWEMCKRLWIMLLLWKVLLLWSNNISTLHFNHWTVAVVTALSGGVVWGWQQAWLGLCLSLSFILSHKGKILVVLVYLFLITTKIYCNILLFAREPIREDDMSWLRLAMAQTWNRWKSC